MANDIRALSSFLQGLKRKSNTNEDEPRHKINLRELSADERSDDIMGTNRKRVFAYDEGLSYDREQFKCPDCNVYCTSEPNMEQHKKGRRHLEVIGQLQNRDREELILTEEEKIRNVMEALGDNKQYFDLFRDLNGRISFHCIVCNVNMQGVDTKVHCSGRRHCENVLDTTDNRNPIDMEIENDEDGSTDRKVEMTKDRQLKMSRDNTTARYNKQYNSVDEETHANLEKLKQILDQREHILDLKERRLILREAECSKREEEVAQREVKLRLEEVKLLSAVNNKELSKNDMLLKRLHGIGENTKEDELAIEHLKPSEKRYYCELVTQKKEIMIAYNTITEKRGLTMEERLAKSKLKIALEDIQLAMNNLTRKGKSEQNQINNNSSKVIEEGIMDPPQYQDGSENNKDNHISPQDPTKSPGRNMSKEDLKKQMEEKLLKEMNKGSLAKLAKIIAQTPSMKAVLENIEKTQDNEVKEPPKSPLPENHDKNSEEKPPSPTDKKVLLNSPPGIHPERYHDDRRRQEDHPDRRREHPDHQIMREREERHRREQELIKRERELRERHEREHREREHHEREREHHEHERRIREHHERRDGPLLEHPPPPIHRRPLLEPPRMERHHERHPEHHRREEFRPKEIYDEEFFVGKRFAPPPERDGGLLPKPVPPPAPGPSNPVIFPDTGKYGIRPHPLSKQKPPLLPRPYDAHFY